MIKASSFAAIKNAGIKAFLTWLLIGSNLSISNFALSLIVLLNMASPGVTKNVGNELCYFKRSSDIDLSDLKGESKINAAILGSLSECIKDVIAPIDLPHSAIVEAFFCYLKKSTKHYTSSLSNHPREIYSPSDLPEPDRSTPTSVILFGITVFKQD